MYAACVLIDHGPTHVLISKYERKNKDRDSRSREKYGDYRVLAEKRLIEIQCKQFRLYHVDENEKYQL